ncbi:retroviral-like aspartic protease family protein [Steroidobacter agaridevorans]|uniref:retroviral-like aspartic protease family protein n=1 Tax=Steroidobacter agaridevorans TaxID=2695856 RepID=UPI0013799282|nr:retroviral-like aspartic protease family protein [Steroidobacter agaridevorans]
MANDVDVPPAPPPPVAASTEAASSEDSVEEVVVAAPEPRYVAPTLRDRIGRVWAPVYINGKGPYKLVLDTGANRTAVIPALAKKIGTPAGTNVLKVLGATGSSIVPAIKVDSIEVGDLFLGDRQVAIVPDVFGGAEGVLGADGLSDKRVHIDFKNDQISILRSTGPMRGNGYTRIPVKLRYGHLLMFEVKLAGVRTRAMLDTGAQTTIGNRSLHEALAKRKRKGVENTIIGVTLDVQKGETVLAPAVELGDLTLRGMHVTFGDMYIFDAWNMTDTPALLIGMDIIGLLDVLIIDYKRRELHLRARS